MAEAAVFNSAVTNAATFACNRVFRDPRKQFHTAQLPPQTKCDQMQQASRWFAYVVLMLVHLPMLAPTQVMRGPYIVRGMGKGTSACKHQGDQHGSRRRQHAANCSCGNELRA
jgi:hypothetical protein